MATLTRYSNLELLDLPDCGGLTENGKCRWKRGLACTRGLGQDVCGVAKARMRLCALDDEAQERIADKYYGGERPWLDAAEKLRR